MQYLDQVEALSRRPQQPLKPETAAAADDETTITTTTVQITTVVRDGSTSTTTSHHITTTVKASVPTPVVVVVNEDTEFDGIPVPDDDELADFDFNQWVDEKAKKLKSIVRAEPTPSSSVVVDDVITTTTTTTTTTQQLLTAPIADPVNEYFLKN